MKMYPVLKHYTMKTYVGVEVLLHTFLTFTLDGSQWSASQSGHFNLRGKSHWRGGWVGHTADLNAVAKEECPCPYQILNHSHLACSLVTILTKLSWYLRIIYSVIIFLRGF
jgi:hypothetical protein